MKSPLFHQVQITPDQVVSAARLYLGIPYDPRRTYIEWVQDRPNGRTYPRGTVHCLSLLVLVAEDLGLMDKGVHRTIRLPRQRGRGVKTPDQAMWEVVYMNFNSIPKDSAQPGDVLIMAFKDVDAEIEPHHVAIKTSITPAPYGSMIESHDTDMNRSGKVSEIRIDALTYEKRLHSAWRLKQFCNQD